MRPSLCVCLLFFSSSKRQSLLRKYILCFLMPILCYISLRVPVTDWRKCFSVVVWLGPSSPLRSSDPCWEVLREQIRRRYPVNKEPAETSCEETPLQDVWFQARAVCARQLEIYVSPSFVSFRFVSFFLPFLRYWIELLEELLGSVVEKCGKFVPFIFSFNKVIVIC